VAGVEAGIDARERPETLDEEGRAGHEHHRQGRLGDDEEASQPLAARGGRRPLAAPLEDAREVRPRHAKGRDEAREDAGEDRHGEGEEEHPAVEADPVDPGQRSLLQERIAVSPTFATRSPRRPPAVARITLSPRRLRTSESRPAPIAALTASSRCRVSPRARRSPATFVAATRRTSAAAAKRIDSGLRTPPTTSSRMGMAKKGWECE
jgi:hypothetical protein